MARLEVPPWPPERNAGVVDICGSIKQFSTLREKAFQQGEQKNYDLHGRRLAPSSVGVKEALWYLKTVSAAELINLVQTRWFITSIIAGSD